MTDTGELFGEIKDTRHQGYIKHRLSDVLVMIMGAHWRVESMHWMLDVVWEEDDSGLLSKNANKTLNSFRKIALLAHKRYVATLPRKRSVKGNVLAALINPNVLAGVLQCL